MYKPFLLRHGMEVIGGQSNIKSEVNEQIHTIPKLKEGFDKVYVMVDFICIDLTREESENYKMKKSCQQWDSIQLPPPYWPGAVTNCAIDSTWWYAF